MKNKIISLDKQFYLFDYIQSNIIINNLENKLNNEHLLQELRKYKKGFYQQYKNNDIYFMFPKKTILELEEFLKDYHLRLTQIIPVPEQIDIFQKNYTLNDEKIEAITNSIKKDLSKIILESSNPIKNTINDFLWIKLKKRSHICSISYLNNHIEDKHFGNFFENEAKKTFTSVFKEKWNEQTELFIAKLVSNLLDNIDNKDKSKISNIDNINETILKDSFVNDKLTHILKETFRKQKSNLVNYEEETNSLHFDEKFFNEIRNKLVSSIISDDRLNCMLQKQGITPLKGNLFPT